MTTASVLVALVSTAIALWIRRLTWSSDYERAITANIALQGVAVIGMLPYTGRTLGRLIYLAVGHANVTNLIAHDCYVVAASMILFTSLHMTTDNNSELARKFKQRVEIPCTLVIPLLVLLFMASDGDDHPHDNFFAYRGDPLLGAYWLVLTTTICYALGYSLILFRHVIRERGMRSMTAIYMTATSLGVAAAGTKAVTALFRLDATTTAPWIWLTASLCGAGFAFGSSLQWMRYQRTLRGRKPHPKTAHSLVGTNLMIGRTCQRIDGVCFCELTKTQHPAA